MITLSNYYDKKLDSINLKILNFLIDNGRIPFQKIAKGIGITSPTVKRRFKYMLTNGYIKKIGIKINPKRLGFNVCTFLNISLYSNKFISKVIRNLKQIEGVYQIFELAGNIHVKAICYSRNMDEFSLMFSKISQINEIKDVYSEIILNGSITGNFLVSNY